MRTVLALLVAVGICFIAALVGSMGTGDVRSEWYTNLNKPSWQPPDWVFGPVWTLLYTLMGIAAWLVWRKVGIVSVPVALFGLQLLLNMLWPLLYFSLRLPGLAFLEIVFLWAAILATIVSFWPVSRLAAGLLFPYIGWVSFASVLNFTLWQMNK